MLETNKVKVIMDATTRTLLKKQNVPILNNLDCNLRATVFQGVLECSVQPQTPSLDFNFMTTLAQTFTCRCCRYHFFDLISHFRPCLHNPSGTPTASSSLAVHFTCRRIHRYLAIWVFKYTWMTHVFFISRTGIVSTRRTDEWENKTSEWTAWELWAFRLLFFSEYETTGRLQMLSNYSPRK